jgi:hypothetical protein
VLLFWKIRYFDRTDRDFKDRSLYLHTPSLDPVTRAAVELVVENRSPGANREILKYRNLFVEGTLQGPPGGVKEWDRFVGVGPSEYFEDETGKELTLREMGPLLTGDPNTLFLPRGFRPHDAEFMLAQPGPIPLAEVSLTEDEVRLLAYFCRDIQELMRSAVMEDGPGTIQVAGVGPITLTSRVRLETAVSDEEIRSFVTIFRRLYMKDEPANLEKAVAVFVKALGSHPYGKWAEGEAKVYEEQLAAPPDDYRMLQPGTCTFTAKRLIDVFLYTQYAHQPDERRERQFAECLKQVHGNRAVLTWMFLTTIWSCGLKILNAGTRISEWFRVYCEYHRVSPDVVTSVQDDHAGLGAVEKEADRRERLFREKVEKLAADLWEHNGQPQGGPPQFLAMAREQLEQRLKS